MLRSASFVVLLATLLLKAGALVHHPGLLDQPDGVLPLTIRSVLILAMAAEIACLAGLWFARTPTASAVVVLLFIVPASLYRLAGTFYGAAHCPCLGSLSGWWPWLAAHETAVLNTIAAWMSLSALLVLARNPVQRKSSEGVVAA